MDKPQTRIGGDSTARSSSRRGSPTRPSPTPGATAAGALEVLGRLGIVWSATNASIRCTPICSEGDDQDQRARSSADRPARRPNNSASRTCSSSAKGMAVVHKGAVEPRQTQLIRSRWSARACMDGGLDAAAFVPDPSSTRLIQRAFASDRENFKGDAAAGGALRFGRAPVRRSRREGPRPRQVLPIALRRLDSARRQRRPDSPGRQLGVITERHRRVLWSDSKCCGGRASAGVEQGAQPRADRRFRHDQPTRNRSISAGTPPSHPGRAVRRVQPSSGEVDQGDWQKFATKVGSVRQSRSQTAEARGESSRRIPRSCPPVSVRAAAMLQRSVRAVGRHEHVRSFSPVPALVGRVEPQSIDLEIRERPVHIVGDRSASSSRPSSVNTE